MYRRSAYSKNFNSEYTMKIFFILKHSAEGATTSDIAAQLGTNLTPQKIARLIDRINDFDTVIRAKNRNNRVVYKLKSIHAAQGYDVSQYETQSTWHNPGEEGWVSPVFRHLYYEGG